MRVATQEWHNHYTQPVTSQIAHSHKINLTSFVRHGIQTFTFNIANGSSRADPAADPAPQQSEERQWKEM